MERRTTRSARASMSATALWTEEETRALVRVWGAEDVQSQLDGVARNKAIFEKIADCLFPRKPWVPSNMAAVHAIQIIILLESACAAPRERAIRT